MARARKTKSGSKLADEIAKRRGKRYPAHAFIAEHFPDYMEVLLDLDYVIRQKPRRFDEKMHELFPHHRAGGRDVEPAQPAALAGSI